MMFALVFGRAWLRAWRLLVLLPLLAGAPLVLWLLCQLFGRLPVATHAFPTATYGAFLAPALAAVAAVPGALAAGSRLLADRRTGALERLLASALRPGGIVPAETCASASLALALVPVVLLAGSGTGLRPDDPLLGLAGVVGLGLLLGLCAAGCSALLAVLTLDLRALRSGTLALALGGVICSDLLLPASLLPGWVRWSAGGNPVSIAADEARRLFAPSPTMPDYLHAVLVLAALACVVNIAAAVLFSRHPEEVLVRPR